MDEKTSSQKAVIALEVEERLAKEARARRLAGLKQNQGGEALRNEFLNGDEMSSGNHFLNGDEAPLRSSVIRGQASIQAAVEVGTNRKYVDAAKKIKRQAPELLQFISDGLLTIPQAKKLAAMPPRHRVVIVELIKSGVPENVNQAIHRISQQEAVPEEDQVDFLSSKWTNAMYRLRIFFNSLKRQGGIAKLSRKWSRKGKQGYLSELREVRNAMNKCIEYLEKELGR